MKTFFLFVCSFLLSFSLYSFPKNVPDRHKKETYILIHGSWQSPYVWDSVKYRLEQKGHHVIVIDLPGHGTDHTDPATITLDTYRNKVIAAISVTDGRVILVGQSMAGIIITAVAEQVPDRIKKLVYLAAFVPANGESALSLGNQDTASLAGKNLILSPDKLTLDITHDKITDIFCQDASDAAKAKLLANYRAEPAIPASNPVVTTPGRAGSVAACYIHTLQDRAITIGRQRKMVQDHGIRQVYTLNSGHSPYLSVPDQLSDVLLKIGR